MLQNEQIRVQILARPLTCTVTSLEYRCLFGPQFPFTTSFLRLLGMMTWDSIYKALHRDRFPLRAPPAPNNQSASLVTPLWERGFKEEELPRPLRPRGGSRGTLCGPGVWAPPGNTAAKLASVW